MPSNARPPAGQRMWRCTRRQCRPLYPGHEEQLRGLQYETIAVSLVVQNDFTMLRERPPTMVRLTELDAFGSAAQNRSFWERTIVGQQSMNTSPDQARRQRQNIIQRLMDSWSSDFPYLSAFEKCAPTERQPCPAIPTGRFTTRQHRPHFGIHLVDRGSNSSRSQRPVSLHMAARSPSRIDHLSEVRRTPLIVRSRKLTGARTTSSCLVPLRQ